MSINASDFRAYVIGPALAALAPTVPVTKTAADLLMATAANESSLGMWLHQMAGGPALGVFQMEPATLSDTLARIGRAEAIALNTLATPQQPALQIVGNLVYAAALCRLKYWLDPQPLPPDTISGLWSYYKRVYNTPLGWATEPEFIDAMKLTDLGSLPA